MRASARPARADPAHGVGSVTCLAFAARAHLLSAAEDGTLALFRARDWAVLRTLRGHAGRVNAVGVHPSGKLALSVGSDRTLRLWDLMRGTGAASTKLGKGVSGRAFARARGHSYPPRQKANACAGRRLVHGLRCNLAPALIYFRRY